MRLDPNCGMGKMGKSREGGDVGRKWRRRMRRRRRRKRRRTPRKHETGLKRMMVLVTMGKMDKARMWQRGEYEVEVEEEEEEDEEMEEDGGI